MEAGSTRSGVTGARPLRATAPTGDPFDALLLWGAFAVVHLVLASINLFAVAANPIGDVRVVYLGWAEDALAGRVPGIDVSFVYPLLAMVPILLSLSLGANAYAGTWMLLVTLLDAIAFAALVGAPWRCRDRAADARPAAPRYPGTRSAAWFWLAFLLALGPIAMGRIDAITIPLAIVALLWAARRPAASALLLTAATWIKVWPAATIGALLIVSRARGRVVAAAAIGSACIVLAALALGSGATVFSFLGEQSARGLQIEAPLATTFLWLASAGADGALVYYDRDILTFQVTGPGTALASATSTPLMAGAVLALVALGIRAVRRGSDGSTLLPLLTLSLVVALIVCNKVGSPQFVCWLAPPLVLGVAVARERFRTPVVLAFGIAVLTHLVYPYLYGSLLALEPAMLLVLTLRNLLLCVLLLWCGVRVWKAGSTPDAPPVGGVPQSADPRALPGRT
ncbi:glycosyltransferase 87 family protein [Planctomonas psychrotolerans]|uniref:glycosyltransferase 87 family protein n=1 Tax=Planctomonas psychrotolerans TaxID=2528712 RepID=UPI00123BD956|nr:glycosyltransferase 87 family protein [Planctomonas psychrotolerans]